MMLLANLVFLTMRLESATPEDQILFGTRGSGVSATRDRFRAVTRTLIYTPGIACVRAGRLLAVNMPGLQERQEEAF